MNDIERIVYHRVHFNNVLLFVLFLYNSREEFHGAAKMFDSRILEGVVALTSAEARGTAMIDLKDSGGSYYILKLSFLPFDIVGASSVLFPLLFNRSTCLFAAGLEDFDKRGRSGYVYRKGCCGVPQEQWHGGWLCSQWRTETVADSRETGNAAK